MASKVQQQQLNFPVRKSSRQSKPSRVLQEAKEQTNSPKLQKQSSRRESTPQGRSGSSRRKQHECDSSSKECTPQKTPRARGKPPQGDICATERTPQRTPSARRLFDVDTSQRRDCTPQSSSRQRTGSARRLFEVDTSQRRDRTPQRSASARRTLELQCSPRKRDSTPVRVGTVKQNQADGSLLCKSPSKRKAASTECPSTPPKSPCKSPGRSSVHKTLPRCPSPEIYSEESDSEEEEGGLSTPRSFVHPHNVSGDVATPSKIVPCVQAVHSPTTAAMKIQMAIKNAESISDQKHPCTPTKATHHSPLPKRAAQSPGSPHTSLLSTGNHSTSREVPSPFKTPTATPQKVQPWEKVLSPCKRGGCTPQRGQSGRMLSPCKAGSSTPQKPLSEKKVLSPKKVAGSPRRSPTSPDKKLASLTKGLTPGDEENFTLKSPKLLTKLSLGKQDTSGYQRAKQSLHTAKPSHLVGREKEVREISDFLRTHLEGSSAGSLYISGAPGTGKTAALLHIIDDFKSQYMCRMAYVNCMMVKEVPSVFRRLHSELSGKPTTGRTSVRDMENLVTTSKTSMILILDEIDQLDSKNQEVLYTIFEWPALLRSKLILIGVANALDLTDRILPRLQAKPRCRPTLLHFAPYTRDQITAVIKDRLVQSGESIVENSAIQFCARKVAAVAGDMRKALDVCRRAVELAEAETGSQTVLTVSDCNSPRKQQAGARKIGVAHISRVMEEVYGSSVQRQQSEGVPLQQKLVVCSLLLMLHAARIKEVSLGKLHETYCKVCRRQQMWPVDQSEFHSLCVLLEARGVVGLKKAKETRLMKVTLRQDEKELEQTLKDRVLVSAILADGLPK